MYRNKLRIIVEVPPRLHLLIKKRAMESGLTMKAYVLKALMEKNERDKVIEK
jgi:hypothetical protein